MNVSRGLRPTTAAMFVSALNEIARPSEKQKEFLQAHYKVGYKNHGGINLQYGILAKRITDQLGLPPTNPYLSLLVKIKRSKNGANDHYNLIMGDEFAKGLKSAGWVY